MKTAKSSHSNEFPSLTTDDLKKLKAPFSRERLGVKVQSLNKEKSRALLVLYLQHTDVQNRIEEVDPAWTCEVLFEDRVGDTFYVRSRLTIKGVSRENVGEGNDPKAAYSDALKRCAMLFGIGRYLYDSPTVWADYNEARDRFKQWSVKEYEAAIRPSDRADSMALIGLSEQKVSKPGLTVSKKGGADSRPREDLNRILMNLYRPYLTRFPETQFSQLLKDRYQVSETRLMAVEQLEDLVKFMEGRMSAA